MGRAMDFEITMRLLFGDRAYHIADLELNQKHRRDWLQKSIKKLRKQVDKVDTTIRHKELLSAELEKIAELLKGCIEPSWDLTYGLFRLVFRLLGYDYVKGSRCYTPTYWRSIEQHYTSVILDGGDAMQHYYDQQNALTIRRTIVEQLVAKELDTYTIALVLNTTEYEVKRLRSGKLQANLAKDEAS